MQVKVGVTSRNEDGSVHQGDMYVNVKTGNTKDE
jgi:hypothetical protein